MSHLHGITTRLRTQLLEAEAPADLELLMARLERRLQQEERRSAQVRLAALNDQERLSA